MVWRSVRHSSHVTRQHVTHHLHQHGERNSSRNASSCVESASRARGHRRSSSMLEHTRVHRVRTRAHSRANSRSKHSACARVFETWEAYNRRIPTKERPGKTRKVESFPAGIVWVCALNNTRSNGLIANRLRLLLELLHTHHESHDLIITMDMFPYLCYI